MTERKRIKTLERENGEQKKANKIPLRPFSYFAQTLHDRRGM